VKKGGWSDQSGGPTPLMKGGGMSHAGGRKQKGDADPRKKGGKEQEDGKR